ncbi:hypothetical protein G4228_014838 [Cervus hanglu yarkandensis]|nr:hypothetical protein G4228_014838 [Cervus hanglu yarkandensis]
MAYYWKTDLNSSESHEKQQEHQELPSLNQPLFPSLVSLGFDNVVDEISNKIPLCQREIEENAFFMPSAPHWDSRKHSLDETHQTSLNEFTFKGSELSCHQVSETPVIGFSRHSVLPNPQNINKGSSWGNPIGKYHGADDYGFNILPLSSTSLDKINSQSQLENENHNYHIGFESSVLPIYPFLSSNLMPKEENKSSRNTNIVESSLTPFKGSSLPRTWESTCPKNTEQSFHLQQNVDNVIEEVKNICSVLGCVETKQITDAVNELNLILQRKAKNLHQNSDTSAKGLIEKVTTELSTSIYQLIDIHCSSFYADFQPLHAPLYRVSCENLGVPSHLSFTVYAAHNIPETWVHSRSILGSVLFSMTLQSEPPMEIIAPGVWDVSQPSPVTLQIDFPATEWEYMKLDSEENGSDLEEPPKECLKHIARLSQKQTPILFPDQEIRNVAVQQLDNLLNDELLEYLPQLVQAVKFEWSLESPLVQLLLHRSLQSIQVAHRLYWLLKDAQNEAYFKSWYQKLLAALQFCAGKALRDEFAKEQKLIKILGDIGEKVKGASDPQRQACSYFTSNALPLKITFINANPMGKNISVIFKAGDDLRQDMLVLQIIQVMDNIWLQEGLDMQMIVYRCLSTGKGQGLVQMVPDAVTLAKIHRRFGPIGPLKENTIKKWFSQHNPLKVDYEKVLRNFFYSCAGWCVVTFILGVCDRHNDNIMLTKSGHMFHIDFGKFLGHAQTFGGIKRDRAPFIFTSEMEYFITEGGKNPQHFQDFVELCCRAYNIVRRHSRLLLNLLEMMLHAGLPELSGIQDLKYVYNNLRPQDTDLEATSHFTKKIKESLECFPVKLNNLIHTLAQMTSISPAKSTSQTFSQESCMPGASRSIQRATILGFSKKTSHLYLIQVTHSNNETSLTEKSFDQFAKLHSQLQTQFASLTLPEFPHWWHLPFPNSDHKRFRDLNHYMEQILNGSYEVANSDCVHSFFLSEPVEQAVKESSAVVYDEVTELQGHVLMLIVKSKTTFVGAINIQLCSVMLNEEKWYPLGNSII